MEGHSPRAVNANGDDVWSSEQIDALLRDAVRARGRAREQVRASRELIERRQLTHQKHERVLDASRALRGRLLRQFS